MANLTEFFNTRNITHTHIISDYEGEKILDLESGKNLLICGDILDSTVGGGGDASKISVNGSVGGISKNHNLYNIHQVITNNNIQLILGNRDLNKLKCAVLCKVKNNNDFNIGNITLNKTDYEKYKPIIKQNGWIADMNNWLPFWNPKIDSDFKDNWNKAYDITKSNTPFLDRFYKIFGVDGSEGTMSAGNLLYTIPFEVLGVDGIKKNKPNITSEILEIPQPKSETEKEPMELKNSKIRENKDYLAFIVLSVFNAGFNKNSKKIDYTTTIDENTNLTNTYINGLFYKFFNNVGKNINFIGYLPLDKELYLFSHGGITADLINKPELEDLKKLIDTHKAKITNTEAETQVGGAIIVDNEFTSTKIIESIVSYNNSLNELLIKVLNNLCDCNEKIKSGQISVDEYKQIPTNDVLLLLSLSAPYRPTDKEESFVMRSPINPGIVELIDKKEKKSFVCSDAKLTQIFGHVPKGFGPSFFTLKKGDKKSYIANIDISQSFKYSGWAGKTDVKIGFNKTEKIFTLYYTLDFSDAKKIQKSDKDIDTLKTIFIEGEDKKINTKDNGKYILINCDDLVEKKLTISQKLEDIFTNEEKIKENLKDKLGSNVILYHGKTGENIHVFTLTDSNSSFNKVLVLYKEPSQSGGYYEKYIKYKNKYMKLKNSML
jgi:hypothetical protein